jgi:hypothetical protein
MSQLGTFACFGEWVPEHFLGLANKTDLEQKGCTLLTFKMC